MRTTLMHKRARQWQPTDLASVLIISVPRGSRQIATIASELPGMGYLLQTLASSTLADIVTAQFFHHLERRTQVCRCELTHLGEIAEIIPDLAFREECTKAAAWRREKGLPLLSDDVRQESECLHAEMVNKVSDFIDRHDAVETVHRAVDLAEVLRCLPPLKDAIQAAPAG